MRLLVPMLAAVAMVAATPAQAMTKEQLDCPLSTVTTEFADRLSVVMIQGEEAGSAEDYIDQLIAISDGCVKSSGLSEDQATTYFKYTLAVVPRSAYIRQLDAAGLNVASIDTVLEFGPGLRNPVIDEVSEDQAGKIIDAQIAKGVDIEKVDPSAWEKVGGYASATSLMYAALRELP